MKIPNNFDLRSLQVFVVTADQGGMTQSARVLRMTQSAVSQIIAGLEDAVETKLFDRSVRPIVPIAGIFERNFALFVRYSNAIFYA